MVRISHGEASCAATSSIMLNTVSDRTPTYLRAKRTTNLSDFKTNLQDESGRKRSKARVKESRARNREFGARKHGSGALLCGLAQLDGAHALAARGIISNTAAGAKS
jgi:hypothetical protein